MKTLIAIIFVTTLNAHALFADVINIEHQIRLCEDEQSIIKKLNLDHDKKEVDLENKKAQVYYIETKNRKYDSLNWSIRVRVKSHKTEITVKKKYMSGEKISDKYPDMICEYDLHGPIKEYSCKVNADIENSEFEQVLKNHKNWLDILDSEQVKFLKENNAVFSDAVVFGILDAERIQWQDHDFNLVTLDLVHQHKNGNNTFHEISIRYPVNSSKEIGKQFESYLRSTDIKLCADQIDWPVNKFEVLEILNLN